MMKVVRFFSTLLSVLCAVLVAGALALWFAFYSPYMLQQVNRLSNLALRYAGISLEIGEITSLVPLNIHFKILRFRGPAAEVTAHDLKLTLSIGGTLRRPECTGYLQCHSLEASIQERPQAPSQPSKEPLQSLRTTLLEGQNLELPDFGIDALGQRIGTKWVSLTLTADIPHLSITLADNQPLQGAVHRARLQTRKSQAETRLALQVPLILSDQSQSMRAEFHLAGTQGRAKALTLAACLRFCSPHLKVVNQKIQDVSGLLWLAKKQKVKQLQGFCNFSHRSAPSYLWAQIQQNQGGGPVVGGLRFSGFGASGRVRAASTDILDGPVLFHADANVRDLSAFKMLMPQHAHLAGNLSGSARAEWHWRKGIRDLSLTLQGERLQFAQGAVKALRGRLSLSGDYTRPTGTLSLAVQDALLGDARIRTLLVTQQLTQGSGPITLAMQSDIASVRPVALQLAGTTTITPDKQVFNVTQLAMGLKSKKLHLQSPTTVTLRKGDLAIDTARFLQGKNQLVVSGGVKGGLLDLALDLNSRIEYILQEFLPAEHITRGLIRGQVAVTGPLARPILKGELTLSAGRYENLSSGTLVKDIVIHILADEKQLRILKAQGADQENNRVVIGGTLDYAPHKLALTLKTDKFFLFYLDKLRLAFATQDTTLSGPLDDLTLAGSIDILKAGIDLTGRFQADVQKLNIVNRPREMKRHKATKLNRDRKPYGHMDLAVKLSRDAHLYGRSVNSYWGGKLNIVGALNDPGLEGTLRLRKGSARLFGQRLTLRSGSLNFDKVDKNDPYFSLQGDTQVKDIKVTIGFQGRVSNPDLVFSSDPSLPREEILSYLLFGGNSTNLSPLRALTLVKTVTDLSGGLSRLINGDQNDTMAPADGEEESSFFDKFGERVHVDFNENTEDQDTQVVVDLDLNDRLAITSEVSTGKGNNSIGLKYRYDY